MNIPSWALRTVTTEDQGLAKDAHQQGRLQITWPNIKTLRSWAKQQGWSTPFFGFEETFIAKMFETRENFELALEKSGIEIQIPRQNYTISNQKIRELDSLYEERSVTGRPNRWGILVEELREIRRAVEAGVVVNVEGEKSILNWQNFYTWAHGRYHMLEDGYDKWIGDDA
jgi:hypothetical protein